MNKRKLNNHNRYKNTFIVALPSDLTGLFTEPVGNGNHESHSPIRIVELKRNNNRAWYDVVFDGEAYVEVTLDEKGRPGHFEGYEEA